ncbi:MAG TPA: Asd/ArgC dimerization domain-containing protein [Terriglobia bacterium]|nr:Asd/ArgC dimerization domain-containing protein [Terriglobia bacterium]
MKTSSRGYNIAVVGASSLLGKELASVLEERKFPVAHLVTFEAGDASEEEPDLPILDLGPGSEAAVEDLEVKEADIDFAFLAARPKKLPAFLRPSRMGPSDAVRCIVIDVGETLAEVPGLTVSAPFLGVVPLPGGASGDRRSRFVVSAHPAAIVISSLLLPLASRFEVKTGVAEIFIPASYSGPRGIEELQKQTVNLLSFQEVPSKVFGGQLAFNLLPRFGRRGRSDRSGVSGLSGLEAAIRNQLRQLLGDRVPLPALRLVQMPVFYSLALSLYIELAEAVPPEKIAAAVTEGAAGRVRLRRPSEPPPSPTAATGSGAILLDAILPDAGRPGGIWLWAAVDNLRLAAVNAVEIAERLQSKISHRDTEAQRTH